jgi:3-oxoadipate enol-lactonase
VLPHDELGSGPALVLLHAGVADRSMWADHLRPLADAGYRAVAPELPGFGEVPLPEGKYAPWADVLRTMDELAIERAALVGNSFGADVALRVALVAPDRVSALVLC